MDEPATFQLWWFVTDFPSCLKQGPYTNAFIQCKQLCALVSSITLPSGSTHKECTFSRARVGPQLQKTGLLFYAQQSVLGEVSGMTSHCSALASVTDDRKELWSPPQDALGHKSASLCLQTFPILLGMLFRHIIQTFHTSSKDPKQKSAKIAGTTS